MKAIKSLISILFAALLMVACKQNPEHEVNVADEHSMHSTKKLDVKVDNTIDPICGMKTAEFLTDTVHFQGKIYGFCSPMCKQKFAKNPEEYLSEIK